MNTTIASLRASLSSATPASRYSLGPAATRTTAPEGSAFRDALRGTAAAAISGAQAAAQRFPGGPLVAATLSASVSPQGTLPGAPLGAPLGAAGAPPVAGELQTTLDRQADNALHYLQLQQQVQDENRNYTTLSNVMKARHDTVKSAIGNLR